MKYLMISFFTILFLLKSILFVSAYSIGVFNFLDKSGYSGKWKITSGISELVSDELNKAGYKGIYIKGNISTDKNKIKNAILKYTNLVKCDIYITGKIIDFSVSQIGVLSVGLGGYNRYAGEVKIDYYIINRNSFKMIKITEKKKVADNNIGVSFLGGPGVDDISEPLYERLNKVPFGSNKFFKTVIGRALKQNIKNFIKKLKKQFATGEKSCAKVVQIEKNKYVYINLGSSDNVKKGDKYIIYREGEDIYEPTTHILLGKSIHEIAVVQIDFIVSDKLSKAKIVKWISKEKILAGAKIKKL